jgi:hypothetical protein
MSPANSGLVHCTTKGFSNRRATASICESPLMGRDFSLHNAVI